MIRTAIVVAALALLPVTANAQTVGLSTPSVASAPKTIALTSGIPRTMQVRSCNPVFESCVDVGARFTVFVPSHATLRVRGTLALDFFPGAKLNRDLRAAFVSSGSAGDSIGQAVLYANDGFVLEATKGHHGATLEISVWSETATWGDFTIVAEVTPPSEPGCPFDAIESAEQNDELLSATVVAAPAFIDAAICLGDIDYYLLAVPTECPTQVTMITGGKATWSVDPGDTGSIALGIFDAVGTPLDESADGVATAQLTIPAGLGAVYIGVYGTDDHQSSGHYRLSVATTCPGLTKTAKTFSGVKGIKGGE